MSFEAAGTVAGLLCFSKVQGGIAAKRKPNVAQPWSLAQRSYRAIFGFLTNRWPTLVAADQDTWTPIISDRYPTAREAYLAFNIARWKQGLTPRGKYPPNEAVSGGQFGVNLLYIGRDKIVVTAPVAAPPDDNWGALWYLDTVPIVPTNLQAAIFDVNDVTGDVSIEHIRPGHYYLNVTMQHIDGQDDQFQDPDLEFDLP